MAEKWQGFSTVAEMSLENLSWQSTGETILCSFFLSFLNQTKNFVDQEKSIFIYLNFF
jgi:hypothetical protein